MGSSPIAALGSSGGEVGGWRWNSGGNGGGKSNNLITKSGNGNHNINESSVLSSTFAYFLVSFVVLGTIGSLYARYVLIANVRTGIAAFGCQDDTEGSWALGIFYGDSPFSLKPIEDVSFLYISLFLYISDNEFSISMVKFLKILILIFFASESSITNVNK